MSTLTVTHLDMLIAQLASLTPAPRACRRLTVDRGSCTAWLTQTYECLHGDLSK